MELLFSALYKSKFRFRHLLARPWDVRSARGRIWAAS